MAGDGLFAVLLLAAHAAAAPQVILNIHGQQEFLCFVDPWDPLLNYRRCCEEGDPTCWVAPYTFDRCCWDSPAYSTTVDCEGAHLSYCLVKLGLRDVMNEISPKLTNGCLRADFMDGSIIGIDRASNAADKLEGLERLEDAPDLWEITRYACEKFQDAVRQSLMPLMRLLYGTEPEGVLDNDPETHKGSTLVSEHVAGELQRLVHLFRAHTWERHELEAAPFFGDIYYFSEDRILRGTGADAAAAAAAALQAGRIESSRTKVDLLGALRDPPPLNEGSEPAAAVATGAAARGGCGMPLLSGAAAHCQLEPLLDPVLAALGPEAAAEFRRRMEESDAQIEGIIRHYDAEVGEASDGGPLATTAAAEAAAVSASAAASRRHLLELLRTSGLFEEASRRVQLALTTAKPYLLERAEVGRNETLLAPSEVRDAVLQAQHGHGGRWQPTNFWRDAAPMLEEALDLRAAVERIDRFAAALTALRRRQLEALGPRVVVLHPDLHEEAFMSDLEPPERPGPTPGRHPWSRSVLGAARYEEVQQMLRDASVHFAPEQVFIVRSVDQRAHFEQMYQRLVASVESELDFVAEQKAVLLRSRSPGLRTALQRAMEVTSGWFNGSLLTQVSNIYHSRLAALLVMGCEHNICSREVAKAKVEDSDFGQLHPSHAVESYDPANVVRADGLRKDPAEFYQAATSGLPPASPEEEEALESSSKARIRSRKLVLPQCHLLKQSPALRMAESHLWPPPLRLPASMRDDFLLYGKARLQDVFFMQKQSSEAWGDGHEFDNQNTHQGGGATNHDRGVDEADEVATAAMWEQGFFDSLLDEGAALHVAADVVAAEVRHNLALMVERGQSLQEDYWDWRDEELLFLHRLNTTVGDCYGGDVAFLTDTIIRRNIHSLQGKRVAVVGSERPWVELLLLWHGASEVVTIDYRRPNLTTHPHQRWSFLLFAELLQEGPSAPRGFDALFSYSSVEHAGLGRYGEPLNPWADVQTLGLLWCHTVPEGYFFLGPNALDTTAWMANTTRDMVHFNAGRDYGRAGWSRLLMSWHVDIERSTRFLRTRRRSRGFFALQKQLVS